MRYERIKATYEDMFERNREFVDELKAILSTNTERYVNGHAQLLVGLGYTVDICERKRLPYEVYRRILRDDISCVDISGAISKSTVPICHIDIIPDPQDIGSTADTFISGFIKMFEGKIASTGRAITDFYADEDHGFVFVVEDRYRNAFACRIIMREHYDEQRRCVGVTRTSKSMRKMKQQKEKRSTFS
ncbi:MAG: hypothetical protein J5832_02495 [Clostridia bacterium]|nr:hypothetical protein [Clostridia bacterium]